MHRSRRTICLCPAAAECRGGEPKVRFAEGVGAAPFASKGAGFSRRVPLTAPMNPAGRSQNVSLIHAFSIDYRPIRNSFNPLDIRQQLSRFVSDNSELLMHTFPANPLITSFCKLGTGGLHLSRRLVPWRNRTQKHPARTSTCDSNHLRTLLHFAAGSPLLSYRSPKHTGGIPLCGSEAPKQIKSRKIIEFPLSARDCALVLAPTKPPAESSVSAQPGACYLPRVRV